MGERVAPIGPAIPRHAGGGYEVDLSQAGTGVLRIRLAGAWTVANGLPSIGAVRDGLRRLTGAPRIAFDAESLAGWDSALVSFALQLVALGRESGATVDLGGLPNGLRRLVSLATAVPERKDAARAAPHESMVTAVGLWAIGFARGSSETLRFLGEITLAFGRLLRGRASFRAADFWLYAQECGAQALPIITVTSILVGVILAFVGAAVLKQYGADIYVALLVVIALSREMAALITSIVLAGRTGAAYAAQIGTMQGNEEVDALTTLGISPIEFLVLPRALALLVMTPILCVYSNAMGLLGGILVDMAMLNVSATQYIDQTIADARLDYFAIGIVKSGIFGAIIAFAGCLKGIQCGRSAAAVGDAATSAVVAGILYIILADGVFDVVLYILGI